MPFFLEPRRRDFLRAAAGAAIAARVSNGQNAAAKQIHWALLSDTHLSADTKLETRGFNPYNNLKRAIAEVQRVQPEAILVNGDLAKQVGLPADYELFKTTMMPLATTTPLCLSLGNHDNRKNFWDVIGKPAKGQPQPVQNKNVLVVEQPPVRILILDSLMVVDQAAGLLGKTQRSWLDGFLRSSDETPTLIFIHHTIDDGDSSLLDSDRLLSLLTPHKKVKAIIYGHSHAYKYDQTAGIHLINLPAVGYNFADSEPVGWVDSTITKEGADFTLHAFGGNMAQNGKLTSVHWR